MAATLQRVAIGFGTGAALGVALGLAAGLPGAGPQRGGAARGDAAADPAAGDAADVHRVGRDRRGLQDRVHHLRDVLSHLPDHRDRRASDRSAAAARGAQPRRARAAALHARDPAGRTAGHPHRAPPRRGAGVLRHRDLGVHRRRARPRLPDQRRAELLPGAADARRGRRPGTAGMDSAARWCGSLGRRYARGQQTA